MNTSGLFSTNKEIIDLNKKMDTLPSYYPRMSVIAGDFSIYSDDLSFDNIVRIDKPHANVDEIDFSKITYNSTERKYMEVIEKKYTYNSGLAVVKFDINNRQRQDVVEEATAKAITKASINYDKATLFGSSGNKGILSAENRTLLPSTTIHDISSLIKTLELMKITLGGYNFATTGFKALIPIKLKPMIEESLTFNITGTERVYRSIGQEGVDFEYVQEFVDTTDQIIMSYAPQVHLMLNYTPQVIGQFENFNGSIDASKTIEIGWGTVAIHSLNDNKAILVQPFTIG